MSFFPYENQIEPAAAGMDPDKLNQVVSEFKRQQAKGVFPGG